MLSLIKNKITLNKMIHRAIFLIQNPIEHLQTIIHYNLIHHNCNKLLFHELYHPSIILHKHHHLGELVYLFRLLYYLSNVLNKENSPPILVYLYHFSFLVQTLQHIWYHFPFM